jgi:hypothetical protein
MKAGGYYEHVMAAGPALDRVKAYLRAMEQRESWTPAGPLQYPDYPIFPGLSHKPFRELGDVPGALILQRQFDTIRDEWLAMQEASWLRYAPQAMDKRWQVHLLHHMGVDLHGLDHSCPRTREIIGALPGVCLDYPWGDALFSVHDAGAHLRPHCSVDNLRVRCHLAMRVPEGCSMRVADQTRGWTEGEALLFEDSFEHEVWNRSSEQRCIFILDFWHPGLTPIEIAALTAGFRKAAVRRLFIEKRLQSIPSMPLGFRPYIEEQIALQDREPGLRSFWPG